MMDENRTIDVNGRTLEVQDDKVVELETSEDPRSGVQRVTEAILTLGASEILRGSSTTTREVGSVDADGNITINDEE